MAASNFGISEPKISCHLLNFQDKVTPNDFECTAKNDVKNIFCATQKFELVECLSVCLNQAAKLHSDLTGREALKLSFQYDNQNVVVMPQSWVKDGSAGSVWLGGLGKRRVSLYLRKHAATSVTGYTSFNCENVQTI